MLTKEQSMKALIESPTTFKDKELNELLTLEDFTHKDLREIIRKIFDLNSETKLNNSRADRGPIGYLNRRSQKNREKTFWKKISTGKYSKKILVEGDSWFEYPIFVTEIIDHLNNSSNNYAINSIAYGGDWIANMLFEQEYIEKLSQIKPDVFLISGGGNDLVDNNRIAQLTYNRKDVAIPNNLSLDTVEEKIRFAEKCFNKEFHATLKLFKLQYKLLFQSIKLKTDKFKSLRIFTQGYDYAIPSSKLGTGIIRPITNYCVGNGKWLKTPLLLNGYRNRKEQISIITGMIHYFNEMLISIADKDMNIHHMDCRGVVDPQKGWYNELHPTSKEFKKIARVYEKCIEAEKLPNNSIKVKNELIK